MAIDLGELTGSNEQAAINGLDKARALIAEVLALDTQLNGVEDPQLRAEHDAIQGFTEAQALRRAMRRGFIQWLRDTAARKHQLQTELNQLNSNAAEDTAQQDAAGDEGDIRGIEDDI